MTKNINVDFVAPFLVDPEILYPLGEPRTDVGKAAKNVLEKLSRDSKFITPDDMKDVMLAKGSQISNSDSYWKHITGTSIIYKHLAEEISSRVPDLDVPTPEQARVRGLIHDFDVPLARYGEHKGVSYAQHEKQLAEYFIFRGWGLEDLAKQVPMHCAYLEVLDMIAQGRGFPQVGMYAEWTKSLNEPENPLNIENIKKDFETYRRGEDNLPLTLLVASDYTDIGKQSFDRHLMREDFQEKKRDVLNRYYYNKVNQRQTPPALGYALMEKGGIERVERCFNTTMDILEGREGEYKQHPLLWKRRQ